MSALYRFDLIPANPPGPNGYQAPTGGYVFGTYTAAAALAWALEDVRSGRAMPAGIWQDGELLYSAAQLAELADD